MIKTFASVCTGVGGMDFGLERAGFRSLWMCEIDRQCREVLRYHWPKTTIYEDMLALEHANLERPDIFCGGTPCQGFSFAGLRRSLEDDRSNLCLQFVRLADALGSHLVIWENVPGVLSLPDNAFGCFLGALVGADAPLVPPRSIKRWNRSSNGEEFFSWTSAGMVAGPKRTACWRVLDSQYFGVAQRRQRVYVVCDLGDGSAEKILFECDGMPRNTPPSRKTGEDIAGPLGSRTKGGVRTTDLDGHGAFIPYRLSNSGLYQRDETASTLKERDHKSATDLVVSPLTTKPYGDNLSMEDKLVVGFDKSRGIVSGDKAGALRVNGGQAEGVNDGKADNQCVCITPAWAARGAGQGPSDIAPTLSADSDGDQRAVIAVKTAQTSSNGIGVSQDVTHTIDGANGQAVVYKTDPKHEVVGALSSGAHPGGCNGQDAYNGLLVPCIHDARGNGKGDVSPTLAGQHQDRVTDYTAVVAFRTTGNDGAYEQGEKVGALNTGTDQAQQAIVYHRNADCAVTAQGDVAAALKSGAEHSYQFLQQEYAVRRLTPMECERLQAFPDRWTVFAISEKTGKVYEQADSPRYKQMGNAITTDILYWLGLRILKFTPKSRSACASDSSQVPS